LNGTTAEGGANDKERVHQYCAMPLPMPASARPRRSSQAGGVNPNGNRNIVQIVITVIW